MAEVKLEKDYLNLFDPIAFLRNFYSEPVDDFMYFVFEGIHKAFHEGDLRGKRLLDIGTGPSICNLISAAPRFKEIYLSDYTPANRTFLRKWLDGAEVQNYEIVYNLIHDLEGKRSHWSTRQKELRSKIKDILPCDVRQTSILQEDIGQFDVITSSFCLESAVEDVTSYREVCRKFGSLLKPGGHVVLNGALEQSFYLINEHKYYAFYITKDELLNAWETAGFNVVNFMEKQLPKAPEKYDGSSGFVMHLRKE